MKLVFVIHTVTILNIILVIVRVRSTVVWTCVGHFRKPLSKIILIQALYVACHGIRAPSLRVMAGRWPAEGILSANWPQIVISLAYRRHIHLTVELLQSSRSSETICCFGHIAHTNAVDWL